ncbi:MAG: formate dehydrogenase accessory sulfurtransferase FdhD [Rhodospirillales bacterium]|nr:formate dehydrogenase accessory sulfurtransferase FdhD [Rhodospirillales bacterium]
MIQPVARVPVSIWRGAAARAGRRAIPEETPLAITYDRATYAVMLGTPADLRDFALGFSLSEGVIGDPAEILDCVPHAVAGGIEVRIDLASARRDALLARRRHIAGPGGCGLCGMDSLAEALAPLPRVGAGPRLDGAMIADAMAALAGAQALNRETHGMHAAGYYLPGSGLVLLREDVGRHNALDKLIGAMAGAGRAGEGGLLVLSSRLSIELVQKAARAGIAAIAAISTPTALAVRAAEAAGITLIGIARADGFEVFTHPSRIEGAIADVA